MEKVVYFALAIFHHVYYTYVRLSFRAQFYIFAITDIRAFIDLFFIDSKSKSVKILEIL